MTNVFAFIGFAHYSSVLSAISVLLMPTNPGTRQYEVYLGVFNSALESSPAILYTRMYVY